MSMRRLAAGCCCAAAAFSAAGFSALSVSCASGVSNGSGGERRRADGAATAAAAAGGGNAPNSDGGSGSSRSRASDSGGWSPLPQSVQLPVGRRVVAAPAAPVRVVGPPPELAPRTRGTAGPAQFDDFARVLRGALDLRAGGLPPGVGPGGVREAVGRLYARDATLHCAAGSFRGASEIASLYEGIALLSAACELVLRSPARVTPAPTPLLEFDLEERFAWVGPAGDSTARTVVTLALRPNGLIARHDERPAFGGAARFSATDRRFVEFVVERYERLRGVLVLVAIGLSRVPSEVAHAWRR